MRIAHVVIAALLVVLIWVYHQTVSAQELAPAESAWSLYAPLGVILVGVAVLALAQQRSRASRDVSARDLLLLLVIAVGLFTPALLSEVLFPSVEWSTYANVLEIRPDGSAVLEYRLFGENQRRTFSAAELAAAHGRVGTFLPDGTDILKVCQSRAEPARRFLVAGKTRPCSPAQARVNRLQGALWLAGLALAAAATFVWVRRERPSC